MKWLKYIVVPVALVLVAVVGFAHLAPQVTMDALFVAERSQGSLVRKTITLEGGEHFAYLEGGKGEPLVLIHGFGGNKDNFTRVAKRFTSRYHVIIPDLMGFGESSRPPKADYSPAAQAERLHRLVAALGAGNGVHIGGNSMGGHISMAWASLYPQEVKSMWLLDPGGVWSAPKSELILNYEATGQMPLITSTEEEFLELTKWAMNKPPFVPEVLMRAMAHENIPHVALLTRILTTISQDPIEPKLNGVTTPTLLVWGEKDRLLSVKSVPVLQKLLPQAKAIIMKDIGHMPMVEDDAQAAADYLAFRDQLAKATP